MYKVIELVGSSEHGIEDAINSAISRAHQTVRHLRWFEVTEMRGQIVDGKAKYFQVGLKLGFTMEDGG
jgi:flavin-binding protein dodecin